MRKATSAVLTTTAVAVMLVGCASKREGTELQAKINEAEQGDFGACLENVYDSAAALAEARMVLNDAQEKGTAHTVRTLFGDHFFEFGQGNFCVEGFFQSSTRNQLTVERTRPRRQSLRLRTSLVITARPSRPVQPSVKCDEGRNRTHRQVGTCEPHEPTAG